MQTCKCGLTIAELTTCFPNKYITFLLYNLVCFAKSTMDDDTKKEARRKKLADHRKWLEEMKAKQGEIAAKHSQQRTESMRKSLLRKTERAIQPRKILGFSLPAYI